MKCISKCATRKNDLSNRRKRNGRKLNIEKVSEVPNECM